VARPISASTDRFGLPRWSRPELRRLAVMVLALGVVQAALFYDHFAVALTVVFGLGLGLWLRSWTAAVPALASFAIAYLLAVGTGWLHDARPLWEPLLGGLLALLGGAIGGGIFDLLRRDVDARAPAPARIDSLRRSGWE
jgi:hypothetical protein